MLVLSLLRLYGAVLIGVLIVTSAAFALRTRFWLPRYVHVMAAVGMLLGIGCALGLDAMNPIDPARRTAAYLVLSLMCPAIVYLVFILYGGQRAAHDAATARCYACGAAIPPSARGRCPRCGTPHDPTRTYVPPEWDEGEEEE